METIISAAITAAVTLAVCLITNHAQAEKTRALLDYRLSELEKKQDNAPTLWADLAYLDGIRIIPEVITVNPCVQKGRIGMVG